MFRTVFQEISQQTMKKSSKKITVSTCSSGEFQKIVLSTQLPWVLSIAEGSTWNLATWPRTISPSSANLDSRLRHGLCNAAAVTSMAPAPVKEAPLEPWGQRNEVDVKEVGPPWHFRRKFVGSLASQRRARNIRLSPLIPQSYPTKYSFTT